MPSWPRLNNVTPSHRSTAWRLSARSALQQVANAARYSTDGSNLRVRRARTRHDGAGAGRVRHHVVRVLYQQIGDRGGWARRRTGRRRRRPARSPRPSSDTAGTTPFATGTGQPGADDRPRGPAAPVQVGVACQPRTRWPQSTGSIDHRIVHARYPARPGDACPTCPAARPTTAGFTALVQDTRTSLSGAIGCHSASRQACAGQYRRRNRLTTTQTEAAETSYGPVDPGRRRWTTWTRPRRCLTQLSTVQTQLTCVSYKLIIGDHQPPVAGRFPLKAVIHGCLRHSRS